MNASATVGIRPQVNNTFKCQTILLFVLMKDEQTDVLGRWLIDGLISLLPSFALISQGE